MKKVTGARLSPRLALQVAISLAANGNDVPKELLAKAKSVGMSSSEIQAIRRGSSFYVRDSAVVELARTIRDGASADIALKRKKALDMGFTEKIIQDVERMVRQCLAQDNKKRAGKESSIK